MTFVPAVETFLLGVSTVKARAGTGVLVLKTETRVITERIQKISDLREGKGRQKLPEYERSFSFLFLYKEDRVCEHFS